MKIQVIGDWHSKYPRNTYIKFLIKNAKYLGNYEITFTPILENTNPYYKTYKFIINFLINRPNYTVIMYGNGVQRLSIIFNILKYIVSFNPIIITDSFYSIYNAYVEDRKIKKSKISKIYYYLLDKLSFVMSDKILLDTETHKKYIAKKFKIPYSKIVTIPLCPNLKIFKPCKEKTKKSKDYKICFHGKFIPLQGVNNIVRSAKYLPKNYHIIIIGSGQEYKKTKKIVLKENIKNVFFLGYLDYKKLRKIYCEKCDICLGIFGNTIKTEIVIPNKVYECIAMKKIVITKNTSAIKELFKKEVIVTSNSPEDIAQAIIKVIEKINKNTIDHLIDKAYDKLFVKCYNKKYLKKYLTNILKW